MITGFNTDIEFDGITYHVQTEDKGLSRPIILSLVYDRGTILASKRAPYDDLLAGGFDEKILAERLQKQHRLICAAVRAGRIEDLKRMSSRETVKPAAEEVPAVSLTSPEPALAAAAPSGRMDVPTEAPIPRPRYEVIPAVSIEDYGEPSVVEGISIIEEVEISPDAVAVVSELVGRERPVNSRLKMDLLGDDRFFAGQRRSVDVMLFRGSAHKIVRGAQIMAKILGSSFRPLIFHAVTDSNGIASITLNIPNFTAGRAALLIRAIDDNEQIELRRVISHN